MYSSAEVIIFIMMSLFLIGLIVILILLVRKHNRFTHNSGISRGNEITIQLRLKAIEELVISLNRVSPENLLPVLIPETHSAEGLSNLMADKIRSEFVHSSSKGIYISDGNWELVLLTRDTLLKLAASVLIHIPNNASPLEYAQTLLRIYLSDDNTPVSVAVDALKNEAKTILLK